MAEETKPRWLQFNLSTAVALMFAAGWLIWTGICCVHYVKGVPLANALEVVNVTAAVAFAYLSPVIAIGLIAWCLCGLREYLTRRRSNAKDHEVPK